MDTDLTRLLGLPAIGPAGPVACVDAAGRCHVFFAATDSSLHEVFAPGSAGTEAVDDGRTRAGGYAHTDLGRLSALRADGVSAVSREGSLVAVLEAARIHVF
jgi:hypothetical protein